MSVFMISCREGEVTNSCPLPKGNTEGEGTETLARVNAMATMNVMDMDVFDEFRTYPISIRLQTYTHTEARRRQP